MKEVVVISGKGGTGKTSIVASFASLASNKVMADCDVDAADLHLVLSPRVTSRESFIGSKRARIMPGHCTACGKCEEICRFDAVSFDGPGNGIVPKTFRIDPLACEGCGVCVYFCSERAIEFKESPSGEWYLSETRHGPMVHAKLFAAEENSGKLVTLVRNQAKLLAKKRGLDLVIVDGAPGIGCPVIASITGADLVLIVAEPTLSGQHDMERVAQLASHFDIPTAICVNKFDLNVKMTEAIEARARELGMKVVGRVRYDAAVTKAQVMRATVVEYTGGAVAQEVRALWRHIVYELG